jgi:hypothetical protein
MSEVEDFDLELLHNPNTKDEQMPLYNCHSYNIDEPRRVLEMYSLDELTQRAFRNLDEYIDDSRNQAKDIFSIADLIRGHNKRPQKRQKTEELRPIVFVRFNTKATGRVRPVTLKALLDSGGAGTLVAANYAKKLKLKPSGSSPTTWSTPAGKLTTTQKCKALFTIPELHDDRVIEWNVHVAPTLGSYDMIIGRDILQDLGIDIQFSTGTVHWDGNEVPLKPYDATEEQTYHVQDSYAVDEATERLKGILDAKYEAADLKEVARESKHLSPEEQQKLYQLLCKHETLFDGTLGHWKDSSYQIELKPDATPYHARAFPIPRVHTETLRMEVERLCEAGVLKRVNRSEWAAPTFIIPKKDGSVRFISDFRELNKRIRRKPYPIPKIQDMLLNLEGFQYATSLDLNMGYYHIELTPDSKKYCTIVLPFGKFEYQRLPMGLCNSPDIFQEKMSELFYGMDFVRAYIDDLLVTSAKDLDDHLEKLDLVLENLKRVGLKVNAKKSFFARNELEYLGYWITRSGIQPLPKKVEAILKIAEPKNRKGLRGFIGIVNYYRDMWRRRSHILAPLAALTSKTTPWKWTSEHSLAFQEMKRVISKEVLLAYPDFNEPFVIHTDASHTQLGAVISQKGKPIAFYSRKLKPEQTRYTTTERELLSIVETLKEFRNILLGHKIVVHTDHKNLTCKNFNTERVMRWRLILEEYGPELHYIKGEQNIVADALSRLDMTDDMPLGTPTVEKMAELFAADDNELPFPQETYPLTHAYMRQAQQQDQKLQQLLATRNDYSLQPFKHGGATYKLIVRNGKIVVPTILQRRAVEWYHTMLLHPGETRTELTMRQHYEWHGMRSTVRQVCSACQDCRWAKQNTRKFGLVPEKTDVEIIPWKTVCIDLFSWNVGNKNVKPHPEKGSHYGECICLTMIDPATGWFEIVQVYSKKADNIANVFEREWLMRYPWPEEVVMDRGSEFMAEVISLLRNEYGLKRKPITARNPQANAMIERAHKTVLNMLRTQNVKNMWDLRERDPVDPWAGFIAATRFAMRATYHTTLQATPMQLVTRRDAIHNIQFEADWHYIKERKQKLIRKNNQRENTARVPYQYQVGQPVMVRDNPTKKGAYQATGPWTIQKIYDNGTVKLTRNTPAGGAVSQTWNIRNVYPCRA